VAQARTRIAPLRLDLARFHCTDMNLGADLQLQQDDLAHLGKAVELAKQDPSWPWVFSGRYRLSTRDYTVEAVLSQPEGSSGQHIDLLFTLRDTGQLPRPADISALLPVLDRQTQDSNIHGHVVFVYREEEGVSKIKLPVELVESPALGKAEMRGVRLVLVSETHEKDQEIIVDRPSNDRYFHTVSFNIAAPFDAELPSRYLRQATEVSQLLFATKRERSRRKGVG